MITEQNSNGDKSDWTLTLNLKFKAHVCYLIFRGLLSYVWVMWFSIKTFITEPNVPFCRAHQKQQNSFFLYNKSALAQVWFNSRPTASCIMNSPVMKFGDNICMIIYYLSHAVCSTHTLLWRWLAKFKFIIYHILLALFLHKIWWVRHNVPKFIPKLAIAPSHVSLGGDV